MQNYEELLKKGTTTVGIVCKDGVVLGTERRATMGTLIAHKTTQKLFKVDEHLAITVAGLVGDAQTLVRWLQAEVELYKMKRGIEMTVKGASTLMANILSGNRYYPYWVQLLIGGIDSTGNYIYSIDAAGGSIADKYVSTGSGSPYVYGVLEDHYKDGMSTEEGIDLTIRSLNAAMKRDAVSGDGMNIAVISRKGYKEISDEEINSRKVKMKIN